MSKKSTDSSGISFTALYTSAVWHRNGLSDESLTTREGRWLYHLMSPFEAASKAAIGGNLRTFLLQRHLIIDHLIDQAVTERGVTQVLEIACGLSPRGIRLRQKHPLIHMVETDLPAMASRKAARLLAAGRLGDHHQVMPIDILAKSGEQSLEAVVARAFDNTRPLVVVTEGLTSYFSLETITDFWRRLATIMAARPGSLYLSESYLMPQQALLRGSLHALGCLLGTMTHSQVSFHFDSDQQARSHFLDCGFQEVQVYNPVEFYGLLSIPESRHDPMVRVVGAWS